MTGQKEKVLTCYYCGNRSAMKEVTGHQQKDTENIWDYNYDLYKLAHKFDFFRMWHLFLCPVCNNITLETVSFKNGVPIVTEELLYPFKTLELNNVPRSVGQAFDAALEVRQIDAAICAICAFAIRRNLEMMCKDNGEVGKNLYTMFKTLSDRGILPPILNDIVSVLREIGNAEGHAVASEFSQDLVPSIIEFAKIILDYVYNLPKLIEEIQGRLGKKSVEAKSILESKLEVTPN